MPAAYSQLKTRIQAWRYGKQAMVAAAIVALAGTGFIIFSLAASGLAMLEAESATTSGGAKVVDDNTASGNKALKFTANPASSGSGTGSGTDTGTGSGSGSGSGSDSGSGSGSGSGNEPAGVGDGEVGPDGTLSGNKSYCAQPNSGQGGEGVRLVTQVCDMSQPQVVNYINVSGKSGGMIRFKTSQLCMVAVGTSNSSQVKMAKCDYTNDAMRWASRDDNTLENAESGKCLRPQGGGVGAGLYLEITDCSNPVSSPNQLWCLPNTCNGAMNSISYDDALLEGYGGYCAQPNSGIGEIGVRLVTQTCNYSAPQYISAIEHPTKGGVMIRFKSSYLCMAVAGTANLSEVVLAKCDSNDDTMRWDATADAHPGLKNVASGKCLRPQGGAKGPGLYLEITACNNPSVSTNQAWGLKF